MLRAAFQLHHGHELVEHNLPERVSLRDLGAHRLKDLRHPHHLFQLVIAGLTADFPPLKTLDTSPHNLPIQPNLFIGREKEVAAVQHNLLREGVRLLKLTGPGGVGKTRLGLHVAAELIERLTDRTWFVSLAPLSDPELVITTIAQTLGLHEEEDRSILDQFQSTLHEKQVLLLLDNFEHVASAAAQVADLLAACPRLKVLATSREALHVQAEREFPVPALALPDLKHLPDLATLSQYEAVALFIERAQAARPAFQVSNANAHAVAEICARLDGLEMLAASGEMESIRQVHASCYLALVEEMIPGFGGPEQAMLLGRQEREYANLRVAMQWSLEQGEQGPGREMALRLAWALDNYWDARGLDSEWWVLLEQALARGKGVAASVRAKALYVAANFVMSSGDTDRAEALYQESLALYRDAGDTRGIASCLMQLAWSLFHLAQLTCILGEYRTRYWGIRWALAIA